MKILINKKIYKCNIKERQNMEWKEVKLEQRDWQRQWNLTAYYGSIIIGSIIIDLDGDFNSIIDGSIELIIASNLEEAKKEFYNKLKYYLESEIDYYNELLGMLNKINN